MKQYNPSSIEPLHVLSITNTRWSLQMHYAWFASLQLVVWYIIPLSVVVRSVVPSKVVYYTAMVSSCCLGQAISMILARTSSGTGDPYFWLHRLYSIMVEAPFLHMTTPEELKVVWYSNSRKNQLPWRQICSAVPWTYCMHFCHSMDSFIE